MEWPIFADSHVPFVEAVDAILGADAESGCRQVIKGRHFLVARQR